MNGLQLTYLFNIFAPRAITVGFLIIVVDYEMGSQTTIRDMLFAGFALW